MSLKHLLFAGAATLALAMPLSATARADDDNTYGCNDQRCYDDQANQTRQLNERALDQAQRENEDDDYGGRDRYDRGGPAYDDQDDLRQRDDRDRDDRYGDDDDDDDGAVDTNPYDDRRRDNDD